MEGVPDLAVPQGRNCLGKIAPLASAKQARKVLQSSKHRHSCRSNYRVHAFAEIIRAENGCEFHAHHFGSLFHIYCLAAVRNCVIPLYAFRANRVRQRNASSPETGAPQKPDFGNPLDCGGPLSAEKRWFAD